MSQHRIGNNLLVSICKGASNQFQSVTSTEPTVTMLSPTLLDSLKPQTPNAQTNIRNDSPANCSWYGPENKIKPLALITFFEVILHSLNGIEKINVVFLLRPCCFWWQPPPTPQDFPPTQGSCAGLQSCSGLGKCNG